MASAYLGVEGLDVMLDDGVLRIVMSDASRRNALHDESVRAFIDALETAQSDEGVRAVLVTGHGADFCSGFDVVRRNNAQGARPRVGSIQRRLPAQAHRLIPLLLDLQVPVVAAVRGWAVGLGLQIVLASDFAVVGSGAILWEPFGQRGMTPDGGAAWLLPRVVGPVRTRQLLMLGRRLSGAEALEWGIAHDCVPDDEVGAAAERLARSLADGPTVALGLIKKLVNTGLEQPLRDHLDNEAYAMELASRSPDFREGLAAFIEKRDPKFTGR